MKSPGVLIIAQNGRVVVNDLAVSLCVYLKKLKSDELLFVVLKYDYLYSPYRLKTIEERHKMAVVRCWPDRPDYVPEDDERIKKGVVEFQSLTFNHNYYIRDKLMTKLIRMEEELSAETNAAKIRGLMETMDLVSKKIDDLNDKIMQQESELELRGGGELTWIEQWQMNRDEFNKRSQAI